MPRRAAPPPRDSDGATPSETGAIGTRLRAARLSQSIGVRELSRRLEVSASMISQIETGRVMPSVNTLYAITSELGISLDQLFGDESPAPAGHESAARTPAPASPKDSADTDIVQRAGDRRHLTFGSGVHWELLTVHPEPHVEFLFCTYDVGSESAPTDSLSRHGGHEYGYVEDGRLGVTVGFDTYELEAGDSIAFSSSTPHRLFNLLDDRPTTAVWVVVGRRGDPVETP